ncbi:hypothetical protein GCM10007853_22080 [Algimonas ampicilliniresistens]|jgi:flagellar basal body-associated protein FliL|uniref:Flagellar protein FliL n=1 Tax=Algimonas ampicilliniresistens TaxID=1298735 RepID=A0ABQ5V9Y6_9PROT|nr:flagellar basal body-associated FliL family protein [Algimonas ampicilliniresistens]GLQ24334.1 hypothetical protein GCM10007853_22080 [Algimonas ampicilliniresistens]
MALLKNKKKGSPATPAPAEGVPAPKGGGKLLGLLAPVLVFGAAFGASWVAGVGAPVIVEAPEDQEAHKTVAAFSADWSPQRAASTVALDPLTITAGSQGQILKIGLAIEVWDDHAEIDIPRLKDAFTTYLRALDPAQLSDPSFHVRLKRALLHRARVVIGQDLIADVLITDFLLTS